MTKHTPGPWTTQEVSNGDIHINHYSGSELEGNRASGNIGVVDGKRGEMNRANARLIAAAPELLEVALALVGAPPKYEVGGVATLSTLEVVEMARAAIAKAEGRT